MSKISRDMTKVHPEVRKRVKKILSECKKEGLKVAVFETIRTFERQKWLKSNGKSKTLNSYHRLGLAVDIVFKTPQSNWTWRKADKHWDHLSQIMERNGMRSLWKRSGWDGPHCELRFKGVPTATLYRELRECGGDVERFWKEYVDSRIYKPDPSPAEQEIQEEHEDFDLPSSKDELNEGVTVVADHTTMTVAEPAQSSGFWAWLMSFFRGGK